MNSRPGAEQACLARYLTFESVNVGGGSTGKAREYVASGSRQRGSTLPSLPDLFAHMVSHVTLLAPWLTWSAPSECRKMPKPIPVANRHAWRNDPRRRSRTASNGVVGA